MSSWVQNGSRFPSSSSGTGSVTPVAILTVSGPSATVTGLTPNTTYYFHVHAVDAAGNLSPESNPVTVHTTP